MQRRPPRPTLFPYTTLFRSLRRRALEVLDRVREVLEAGLARDVHAARLPELDLAHGEPAGHVHDVDGGIRHLDRKSTRLNSSHSQISYAVFCLKKKRQNTHH